MLLLKNSCVLDPYTKNDSPNDILIGDDGVILDVKNCIEPPDICEIFNASGLCASPGFVDGHVHFRDPGQTGKEDVITGAAAAAAGGYSTVICMANTVPACDTPETIRYVTEKASGSIVEVLQAGAVTKSLKGKKLTDFDALINAGAPCLTDDGINLENAALCRRAMEEAAERDAILCFHEEEPSLVLSPGVNYGSKATKKFGVQGAMPASESAMVARDIALALDTGAKIVFQHISSELSVKLIRAGKALGADIYAEATPHHLSLTEDDVLQYGTLARMNPPLRKESDRLSLINGLKDGTIDMIATDHAPHTSEEKSREFSKAPSGIIGLETAFSVCNTFLVQKGYLNRMELIEKMSKRPAEIYGLKNRAIEKNNFARIVLLDWDCNVKYSEYRSKASNSPFTGMPLIGRPVALITGTRLVNFG